MIQARRQDKSKHGLSFRIMTTVEMIREGDKICAKIPVSLRSIWERLERFLEELENYLPALDATHNDAEAQVNLLFSLVDRGRRQTLMNLIELAAITADGGGESDKDMFEYLLSKYAGDYKVVKFDIVR